MNLRGLAALTARRARAGRGLLAVLGLTIAVTVAVITTIPRTQAALADDAVEHALTAATPPQRGVTITQRNPPITSGGVPDRLSQARRHGDLHRRNLPSALDEVLAPSSLQVETSGWSVKPTETGASPTFVTFHVQPGIRDHATLLSGRWPEGELDPLTVATEDGGTAQIPILEMVVSAQTAHTLGWDVGTELDLTMGRDARLALRLPFRDPTSLHVRVTGLIEPSQPTQDPFWWRDGRVHRPGVEETLISTIFHTHGVLADDAFLDLTRHPFLLTFRWRADLRTTALGAEQATQIADAAARAVSAPLPRRNPGEPRAQVSTSLDRILQRSNLERSAASSVLAAGSANTVALGLLTVLAGSALLGRRRRRSTLLWRARGGSARQILTTGGTEAVGLAVIAAAVGLVAAELLVPRDGPVTAPLLFTLGSIVGLAAGVAPALRGPPTAGDDRPAPAVDRRIRVATDVFVVIAATGVMLLSRTRSVDPVGGVLALGPVLLIAAGVLLVLRALTATALVVVRRAARWEGLARSLAARIAARDPGRLAPPLAVLAVGVGVTVFAALTVDTIANGQVRAAFATTGSHHRIQAPPSGTLPEGLGAELPTDAPTARLSIQRVPTSRPAGGTLGSAQLVAFGGDLAGVLATTPGAISLPSRVQVPRASDGVVAVASPAYLEINRLRIGDRVALGLEQGPVDVTIVAARGHVAGLTRDEPWLLVPRTLLPERPPATMALIGPTGADLDALVADSPELQLTHAETALDAARARPLARGLLDGFRTLTVLAAAFTLLGWILGLVALDRVDRRDIALLRTLGTPRDELRRLARLRIGATALVASSAGAGLGWAAVLVYARTLDLAGLTDAPGAPSTLGPWTTLTVVGLTTTIASIAAWRVRRPHDPTTLLRRDEP